MPIPVSTPTPMPTREDVACGGHANPDSEPEHLSEHPSVLVESKRRQRPEDDDDVSPSAVSVPSLSHSPRSLEEKDPDQRPPLVSVAKKARSAAGSSGLDAAPEGKAKKQPTAADAADAADAAPEGKAKKKRPADAADAADVPREMGKKKKFSTVSNKKARGADLAPATGGGAAAASAVAAPTHPNSGGAAARRAGPTEGERSLFARESISKEELNDVLAQLDVPSEREETRRVPREGRQTTEQGNDDGDRGRSPFAALFAAQDLDTFPAEMKTWLAKPDWGASDDTAAARLGWSSD